MASSRIGFTTLDSEASIESLHVRGSIPGWLSGTLIRNGPAKFEAGKEKFRHWFDGMAMLHKFAFRDGTISYANRFLKSNAFQSAAGGKIGYKEFATDPCKSIFKRMTSMFSPQFTDNANVNISRMASKFVAMTETPLPVEFDPETLGTVGVVSFEDKIDSTITTAHPHHDYVRGEGVSYTTKISRASSYNVYTIPDGTGSRKLQGSVPVDEPGYMHSFGMTENYVILVEFPFVVRPLDLLLGGKPFIENFEWKPERGTRFIVIDRKGGGMVGVYKGDPFFAFHHVNSFEKDGQILVDVVSYKDSSVIGALYLDVLRGERPGAIPPSRLVRYSIPVGGGAVQGRALSDEILELPQINYERCNGRDYRFAYGISSYGAASFANRLVKIDVLKGSSVAWSEADCYPGEPVFVAAPGGTGEDEGVILSVVLDAARSVSFLLVLDAASFAELARAEVPHHIPFGFHGKYFG